MRTRRTNKDEENAQKNAKIEEFGLKEQRRAKMRPAEENADRRNICGRNIFSACCMVTWSFASPGVHGNARFESVRTKYSEFQLQQLQLEVS